MITLVEFKRGPDKVYIQPSQVVKVKRRVPLFGESFDEVMDSVITLTVGEPEVVEGPPSEVIQRLRKGA